MTEYTDTLTEGVGVDPTPFGAYGWSLVESTCQLVSDTLVSKGYPVTLSQGVGSTDTLTVAPGYIITEAIAIAEIQNVGWNLGEALTDTTSLLSRMVWAWGLTAAEGIGLAETLALVRGIVVAEGLGLASSFSPTVHFGLTLTQGIGMHDVLARFFGGDISEIIGITSVLLGSASMPQTVSEGVGIDETIGPRLVVAVTASDEIGIDPSEVLRMLYAPTVAEGIQIAAAYLSPGDSFTTWAMNTRTGAVTEYQNYNFNSFAKLGDIYIGASADGLFSLTGDDDAGEDIIATLKSGLMQFAGVRFTLFKAIYLGVRGDGEFVLRLVTGEGITYNYAVTTRDMRTTKVHLGKGLRTRYFAFELISTGQDFDLESIEFVPLVANRRV